MNKEDYLKLFAEQSEYLEDDLNVNNTTLNVGVLFRNNKNKSPLLPTKISNILKKSATYYGENYNEIEKQLHLLNTIIVPGYKIHFNLDNKGKYFIYKITKEVVCFNAVTKENFSVDRDYTYEIKNKIYPFKNDLSKEEFMNIVSYLFKLNDLAMFL